MVEQLSIQHLPLHIKTDFAGLIKATSLVRYCGKSQSRKHDRVNGQRGQNGHESVLTPHFPVLPLASW